MQATAINEVLAATDCDQIVDYDYCIHMSSSSLVGVAFPCRHMEYLPAIWAIEKRLLIVFPRYNQRCPRGFLSIHHLVSKCA